MPDHTMTKTAEAVRMEKWRLAPHKTSADQVELTPGEEALANIVGQSLRTLLSRLEKVERIAGRLDGASHGE